MKPDTTDTTADPPHGLKLAAQRWGNATVFVKTRKGERRTRFEAGPRQLVLAAIARATTAIKR